MGKKARSIKRKGSQHHQPKRLPKGKKFRCSLKEFGETFEELRLRPEHIRVLQETPFWHLFEAFITRRVQYRKKYNYTTMLLVDDYNSMNQSFMIGDNELKITTSDASLIFGIINGEKKMDLTYSRRVYSDFVTRRFPDEKELTVAKVKTALTAAISGQSRDDIRDVVRLLCLLLCSTFLIATGGNRVKWGFIRYIEDIEGMRQYDWCFSMLKEVLNSISKSNNDVSRVNGCTTLLQIWLCEHLNIWDINEKSEHAKRPILDFTKLPRFVKWDLVQLNRKLRNRRLSTIEDHEVNTMELVETLPEVVMYQPYIERVFDPKKSVPHFSLYPEYEDKDVEIVDNGVQTGEANHNMGVIAQNSNQTNSDVHEHGNIDSYFVPDSPCVDTHTREHEDQDVFPTNLQHVPSNQKHPEMQSNPNVDQQPSTQEMLVDMWKPHLFCSPIDNKSRSWEDVTGVSDGIAKCLDFSEENVHTPRDQALKIQDSAANTPSSDGTGRSFFEERSADESNPEKRIKRLVRDNAFYEIVTSSLEKEVKKLRIELDEKKTEYADLFDYLQEESCKTNADPTVYAAQATKQIKSLSDQIQLMEKKDNTYVNELQTVIKQKDQEIESLRTKLINERSITEELRQTIGQMKQEVEKMQVTPHQVPQRGIKIKPRNERKIVTPRYSLQLTRSLVRNMRQRKRRTHNISGFFYPNWRKMKRQKVETNVVKKKEKVEKRMKSKDEKQFEDPIDVDKINFDKFNDGALLKSILLKSEVYKVLPHEDDILLLEIIDIGDTLTTIYTTGDGIDSVTLADIFDLLTMKELASNVINCFAEYLMDQQLVANQNAPPPEQNNQYHIVHSLCLKWLDDGDEESLNNFVKPCITNYQGNYRYIIFPLLSQGLNKRGNHWTLAVFDTQISSWDYYNSLRPRTRNNMDRYLQGLLDMRSYVAMHYNGGAVGANIDAAGQVIGMPIRNIRNSPQQTPGTVECGIILCDLMADLFFHNPMKSKCDTISTRAGLIHVLLNTPGRSWTRVEYEAFQKAREIQFQTNE